MLFFILKPEISLFISQKKYIIKFNWPSFCLKFSLPVFAFFLKTRWNGMFCTKTFLQVVSLNFILYFSTYFPFKDENEWLFIIKKTKTFFVVEEKLFVLLFKVKNSFSKSFSSLTLMNKSNCGCVLNAFSLNIISYCHLAPSLNLSK